MMGYVGPVAMVVAGYIPDSLRAKRKVKNRFRLMYGESVASAGAGF